MWTKKPYGVDSKERGGRWIITNGHISFYVHWTIDGSIGNKYGDKDGYIVTPQQADEYATKILNALNSEIKLQSF